MVADHDMSQSDSSFDVVLVTRLSYLPNNHINHMEKSSNSSHRFYGFEATCHLLPGSWPS
jgi:hypothetical protein